MRRTLKTLLAVSLTAGLLGGCVSLDPAYRRPALPTPNAFPDAAAASASTDRSAASIGWRRFFLDPKLQAVIALGLANNRDLRAAVANVEAARAQYRVQRADLFPHVNGAAGVVYGQEPISAITGVATPGVPAEIEEHQYTTSLGVTSYELDLFGRVRSLSRSALEQYFATEEAQRAARISLVSEIATDYLTLSSDEAILQAAKDTLTSGAASLDIAQKRFDHGVASELDVSQAQTLVQQARSDVANDTTQVAQDHNALDLVVGAPTPPALSPEPLDARPMVLAALPAGLPSEVLLARPDVLQAEHQLKSDNAQIGAARAAFFPTITLTGAAGFTSPSLSNLFAGASQEWSFAPQITVPIFAGGANRANLALAKAQRAGAVAQYEKAIQTAFSEVANGLARSATIGEQTAAQEAGLAAAADGLRLSQARYEHGSDTYLNVLIAQRTLYAQQQSLIRTRLTGAANLVTLYAALGGGLS